MKHTAKPAPVPEIHVSTYGTYHPNPAADVAWTINDTRGYIDGGPSCDDCGACECDKCEKCGETFCVEGIVGPGIVQEGSSYCDHDPGSHECIGLSFAYCCLDGGESLCEDCAEKAGIRIVPCDCK